MPYEYEIPAINGKPLVEIPKELKDKVIDYTVLRDKIIIKASDLVDQLLYDTRVKVRDELGRLVKSITEYSYPPFASAVVTKYEDYVYAWKSVNNYKGYILIDKGEAGVEDAEVIQKAIDYVASKGGGEVVIREGKYIISQTIKLKSNIAFKMLKGTTIKLANGANTNMIVLDRVSNIVIEGGTLDGNKTNQTNITGSGQKDGIVVRNSCDNIVIRGVRIKDTIGWGIFMLNSNRILVRDCYLTGITEKGINPEASFVAIVNNYIQTSGGGTFFDNAVEIDDGANHVIVIGNIIEDSKGGISIHSHAGVDSPQYVTVVGNILRNVGRGIFIGTNRSANTGLNHVIITNNIINTTYRDEAGIFVTYNGSETGDKTNNHIVIANNTIYKSAGAGIILENARYIDVIGNRIVEPSSYGIEMRANVTRYGIIANEVRVAGNHGILVNGWYGRIELNHIDNCVDGIHHSGGNFIQIDRNMCLSNSNYGIYLVSSNESCCIGNILGNNTSGAIRIASGWLIINNIGYSTESSGIATFSGDGSTTDFLIGDHGLAVTDPNRIVVKVTPISQDAIAASPCVGYVDPDDNTKIRVKFASAPASGTDNVKIAWTAEVIS